VQIKYHKMMTPSWLKNKGQNNGVRFGTEVEWNDVELFVPADTRFNETIFQVPLVKKDDFDPLTPYAVKIVAALEYRAEGSFIGGQHEIFEQITRNANAIAKLQERMNEIERILQQHSDVLNRHERDIAELKRQQAAMLATISALQAQIAAMRRPVRDPMCVTISGKHAAVGFELRDPTGYLTHGPYRGVEGIPGVRGLLTSQYLPDTAAVYKDGVHAPTLTSSRWPQVFRMNVYGDVSPQNQRRTWGSISSDVDGGHTTAFHYQNPIDPSTGLRFTVFRGERNEVYRINYFEVSVYQ
jgi:hypothetical protein